MIQRQMDVVFLRFSIGNIGNAVPSTTNREPGNGVEDLESTLVVGGPQLRVWNQNLSYPIFAHLVTA